MGKITKLKTEISEWKPFEIHQPGNLKAGDGNENPPPNDPPTDPPGGGGTGGSGQVPPPITGG